MCMGKRNEFGKTFVNFSDKKISEVVKIICSFVNYITLCVSFA